MTLSDKPLLTDQSSVVLSDPYRILRSMNERPAVNSHGVTE